MIAWRVGNRRRRRRRRRVRTCLSALRGGELVGYLTCILEVIEMKKKYANTHRHAHVHRHRHAHVHTQTHTRTLAQAYTRTHTHTHEHAYTPCEMILAPFPIHSNTLRAHSDGRKCIYNNNCGYYQGSDFIALKNTGIPCPRKSLKKSTIKYAIHMFETNCLFPFFSSDLVNLSKYMCS